MFFFLDKKIKTPRVNFEVSHTFECENNQMLLHDIHFTINAQSVNKFVYNSEKNTLFTNIKVLKQVGSSHRRSIWFFFFLHSST